MKPRKITRRVTVTAQEDLRDRLTVSVTIDDPTDYAAPVAHGDTLQPDSPVGKRVRLTHRGGSKKKKAQP